MSGNPAPPDFRWADVQDSELDAEARLGNMGVRATDASCNKDAGDNKEAAPKNTVVLKNIPNRVRYCDMLAAIAGLGFNSDLVRLDLPVRLDKKRVQNKGIAFVWLLDRSACERFQRAASGFSFGGRGSPKALVAALAD